VIGLFQRLWAWLERLRSRRLLSGSLRHDGLIRSYLLYVPRHLRPGTPLPLVLVLHGGASAPRTMARSCRMHEIAEREGFIVAYPAGTPGRAGLTWNPGGQAARSEVDDVGFIRALVADLQRRYVIDPDRVYAAGMSIGGMLAYRLACSLSEHFAAIGVVAGTMTNTNCDPKYPVSIIHIHGTADQRVPLRGGRGKNTGRFNTWPPVRQAIDRWREINGCEGPVETIRLVEGLVGHRASGDADVELWLVEGGRHVWPGAPFSASEKVWNFFAAHPRPSGE
jgi:polyhydroxybutyrate depolymerase